ncbi:MAG: hypothetical protein ACK5LS_12785 [Propioniciclava sp.]
MAAVTSDRLRPLSHIVPQAINNRALNLGSAALEGSGGLTPADVGLLLGPAIGLTLGVAALTLLAIRAKLR